MDIGFGEARAALRRAAGGRRGALGGDAGHRALGLGALGGARDRRSPRPASSTSTPTTQSIVELVELALILTLFSDGMFVERELLRRHWSPVARALVIAMPITMALLALAAKALFPELSWAEAFLLGAVLSPTDPVVTSAVVTSRLVPASVRHTLNLESGLNDGLALPFVLFFLVLAVAGRRRRQRSGEAGRRGGRSAPRSASASGSLGGRLHHHLPGGGITARYEGIYAVGFALFAFGLAEVTIGNGLIAAFVCGIAMGADRARGPRGLRRVRRERQRDPPGAHLLRLRRPDRRHRLRPQRPAAGRSSSSSRCSSPARSAVLLSFVRDRHAAAAEAVHGLVRPEGRRLDALRPLRAQVRGRQRRADLRRRRDRDHRLDRRPRPTDTVGARWIGDATRRHERSADAVRLATLARASAIELSAS